MSTDAGQFHYAEEEDGIFTLALRGLGAEEALVLQLASSIGEEDSLSVMDSYAISSGTGATVYGGISSASASEARVVLTLREDAAAALGVPPMLQLDLPDEAATAVTTEGLRRIGVVVRQN